MGLVGQTFVNGERPTASGSSRILPNAPLPGQAPLPLRERLWEKGLIPRSYKAGLSMPEAFMHNMGGREGLVDTAAKTARTGYSQRRMVKAMESHHVAHDGTVRDAHRAAYQTWFGGDGLDPMKTSKVDLQSLMLDDAQLWTRCVADAVLDPMNPTHQAALVEGWSDLRRLRDETRRARVTCFYPNLSRGLSVYLPFEIGALVGQHTTACGCRSQVDLTGDELAVAHDHVATLCTTLEAEIPCLFAVYHIRDELSTGRLLNKWKVCTGCVLSVCQRVLEMHRAARLQAGEGIGALTATSIGEPLSQVR
jgi:hypothetical protein